jgi:hypothetical protein
MLLARPPARATLLVGFVGAVTVIAGGLVGAHASYQDIRTALDHFRTGDDFARMHVIELVSVGWWTLLALSLLGALLARRAIGAAAFGAIVLALAALDYGHFAHGYNPMAPADRAVPAEPAAVRFLQAHARGERLVGLGIVLPADTSTQYHLEDVRGDDPPFPDKRFLRFFRLINPSQSLSDALAVPGLSTRGRKMLNLLNVRYVVVAPGSPRIAARGLTLSYQGADADIYRDHLALPRAFVPTVVDSVRTEDAVFARLSSERFSPAHEAVIQGSVGVHGGRGAVVVQRTKPTEVELRARLKRRSLVVLANAFHAGWRVSVDGDRRQPVRVDAILQGVVVPPGNHRIRWTYRTPGLSEGFAVSLAVAVGVLGWVLFIVLRRRTSRAARGSARDRSRRSQARG